MNSFKIAFYLLAILSLSIFSCDRGGVNPQPGDFDEASISEIAQAQDAFTDVFNVSDNAMDSSGVKKTSNICADIDLDWQAKTLLIDFGTGCTGPDGVTRSGSIFIQIIGNWWQPNGKFLYTLTDYTVDGIEVDGTLSISSFDRDNNGKLFFEFAVIDGEVNYPNGAFITYETDRVYKWIEGEGTATADDNVYEVSGTATGQNSLGHGYEAETIAGLEYKVECAQQNIHYPAAGELKIKLNNVTSPYLIDYGSGVCDKDIVVNWNGQDYDITLP